MPHISVFSRYVSLLQSSQISGTLKMAENSIKVEQFVDIVKEEEESTSPHIDIDKCIFSPKQDLVEAFNDRKVSVNFSISKISQQIIA